MAIRAMTSFRIPSPHEDDECRRSESGLKEMDETSARQRIAVGNHQEEVEWHVDGTDMLPPSPRATTKCCSYLEAKQSFRL